MINTYKPEGRLLASAENREYLSYESALMRAAAEGKILESVALYCEDRGNGKELAFSLGKMRGIMPKDEVEYNKNGEETKDIAVITRVGKAVCFKIIGFFEENGERIAQLVITPFLSVEFNEVEALSQTARGEGGFGSTGK